MTRNPLTFRVESSLGAVFVSLLSMFFIGLLFIFIKNFNTDIDIMSGTLGNRSINKISQTEVFLMQAWIVDNNVNIPEGSGYRYLIRKYPERPWLN